MCSKSQSKGSDRARTGIHIPKPQFNSLSSNLSFVYNFLATWSLGRTRNQGN